MEEFALIINLVVAVIAAFVGGVVAQRLGQPVILGYLVAGVIIGPFTPGPTADIHSVQIMAEIGVAFLMFALGAEFSLAELRQLGRVASVGGALQICGTMALGPLLAPILNLNFNQGVFLGAILALSSTVVALKVLMGRGESQSMHGRVALGILIAQDLAVVPMVVLLPALVAGSEHLGSDLAITAAKAAAVLIGAFVVGTRVVPWLLERAAISRTRELFLLGVVGLALGTALTTQYAGLSLAFGAFLAGLVVAESDYRTQIIAEVLPLRDLFASLFFVSVGMLIDPLALVEYAGLIGPLVAAVLLGKVLIVSAVVLILGMPARVALLTALSLAQVGEFSFVLARIGVDSGAIPSELLDLSLATALVTILVTPSLPRAAPHVLRFLERLPYIGAWCADPLEDDIRAHGMSQHAVICGFGRVGQELAAALETRGIHYLIVEYNPAVVRELRTRGVPVIYGDASNQAVLEHAHIERARLLAVLMPDATAAELTTRHARHLNRRLNIVTRAVGEGQVERLLEAGATEVVQPEFEAGVEVIRHTLRHYGVSGAELTYLIAGRRTAFYQREEEAKSDEPSGKTVETEHIAPAQNVPSDEQTVRRRRPRLSTDHPGSRLVGDSGRAETNPNS